MCADKVVSKGTKECRGGGGGGGRGRDGWCGKSVVYLTSRGRPTDIDLQLGKACYLYGRYGYRGNVFIFLFLHFHSCSSFFPVPLFHLLYYLFCLFSLFLWETIQNDPQGLTLSLNPTTVQKIPKECHSHEAQPFLGQKKNRWGTKTNMREGYKASLCIYYSHH